MTLCYIPLCHTHVISVTLCVHTALHTHDSTCSHYLAHSHTGKYSHYHTYSLSCHSLSCMFSLSCVFQKSVHSFKFTLTKPHLLGQLHTLKLTHPILRTCDLAVFLPTDIFTPLCKLLPATHSCPGTLV